LKLRTKVEDRARSTANVIMPGAVFVNTFVCNLLPSLKFLHFPTCIEINPKKPLVTIKKMIEIAFLKLVIDYYRCFVPQHDRHQ